MDNGNQFDPLQAMLNQIRIDNPSLRELIEQRIREQQKKGTQKEISNEIIRRLRIQNKKLLEQVASLKEQLKRGSTDKNQIMNKLNYLVKLNNSLSEALGSCNNCWGEDPVCTYCSGNGSPGWRDINKRKFNAYVLPTLEKLYGLRK